MQWGDHAPFTYGQHSLMTDRPTVGGLKDTLLQFHSEKHECCCLENVTGGLAGDVVIVAVTILSPLILDDGFSAASSCVFPPLYVTLNVSQNAVGQQDKLLEEAFHLFIHLSRGGGAAG